jgi:ABC-type multidrug transport system fused ATPase/permease subunit
MDREAAGRKTIAIAHQLGTVDKTDIVFVFDNIRVAE